MQNKVEILIDRFYKGETNSKEEELLLNYLTQESDPLRSDAGRNVIQALSSARISVPSELEQKLASMIDMWEMHETQEKKRAADRSKIEYRKRIIGIAASVLLIIGIGFWYQYQSAGSQSGLKETFDTPQESQEAVVEALQLFSHNFSQGTSAMEKADEQVDKTLKIIDQLLNEKASNTAVNHTSQNK
ncbi:MAG: hypothetical protein LLF81_05045 [Porphyromonadaceae bacterium]|nr:hypothetical protein [Porphyromonadaceae bacterium]